jgi:methyl-accepting chemotaxis protein
MGYTLDDVKGRHHGMFVEENYRQSVEYREFWARLRRGGYLSGEYRRLGKGGRDVWIQGSYTPILGHDGRPVKVVKYATEVTAQVRLRKDLEGVMVKVTENAQALGQLVGGADLG